MNKYLWAYLAVAFVMLALDVLWLGLVAKTMYQQAIGHLMAEQPRLVAALAFYVLFAAGLVVFAIAPQAQDPGWMRTAFMGGFFGLVAYATYDLSNLATLKQWPAYLAMVDMAWGSALSAASALAGRAAMNWAAKG